MSIFVEWERSTLHVWIPEMLKYISYPQQQNVVWYRHNIIYLIVIVFFLIASRWIIDPPLDITVPAKRTPWPDAPPELPSEKLSANQDHVDKHSSKMGRSRSRHSSRSKRKPEQRVVKTQVTGVSKRQEDWETTRKSFSISSSKQLWVSL